MKKQFQPKAKTAKKIQANEKNSARGIQTFFKSAQKDFVVENVAELKSKDGVKGFYVDILMEKLQNIRDNEDVVQGENGNNDVNDEADGACAVVLEDYNYVRSTKAQSESDSHASKTECAGCIQKAIDRDVWEEKYKSEVEKRKALKKVYVNLTIHFSELDLKYNNLLKTATRTYHASVDDAVTSSDIFTKNEVKFLQSMSLDKTHDCTFILHCFKYAYKVDPSVLVSKTLKGTPEWTEITNKGEEIHHGVKTPVTPEKAARIKGLFIERISKCQIDSSDYNERIKDSYVNRLIAAGIGNISKKYK